MFVFFRHIWYHRGMKLQSIFTKIKQIEKAKIICLAIHLGTLFLGLLPYLFIRTSSSYISSFIGRFFYFTQIPLDKNSVFYIVMTSFFSDFCWAFEMPFALFVFTNGSHSKFFYILCMPIMGSILELCQYFKLLDGVGDIIDCLIYFAASFLGYSIIERIMKHGRTAAEQQQ